MNKYNVTITDVMTYTMDVIAETERKAVEKADSEYADNRSYIRENANSNISFCLDEVDQKSTEVKP